MEKVVLYTGLSATWCSHFQCKLSELGGEHWNTYRKSPSHLVCLTWSSNVFTRENALKVSIR